MFYIRSILVWRNPIQPDSTERESLTLQLRVTVKYSAVTLPVPAGRALRDCVVESKGQIHRELGSECGPQFVTSISTVVVFTRGADYIGF